MTETPTDIPTSLGTPGQVAAAIPLLTGFTPQESIVLLSLKEPRGRIGLTMRFDLPTQAGGLTADQEQQISQAYVNRLVHDRATRAVVVVHTEEPDQRCERNRRDLPDELDWWNKQCQPDERDHWNKHCHPDEHDHWNEHCRPDEQDWWHTQCQLDEQCQWYEQCQWDEQCQCDEQDRCDRQCLCGERHEVELPRASLVRAFAEQLELRGIRLAEALLVRDGKWSSYLCDQDCCPRAGTLIAYSERDEPVTRIATERIWSGRRVLASRAELVASLAPVAPFGRAATLAALTEAEGQFLQELEEQGQEASARLTVELVEEALRTGQPLSGKQQLRVIVGMQDVQARDQVVTLGLEQPVELLLLLQGLCRVALPDWDPPVCSALAWIAYVNGDGALANVALERALRSDGTYSLALLIEDCLLAQLDPSDMRTVLVQTAARLRPYAPPRTGASSLSTSVKGSGAARRTTRRQRRSRD